MVLGKNGSPTGNLYAKIYAETHATAYGTDSLPTGTALATSDAFDGSTLSSVYREAVYFTFSSPYTTSNGTKYVVVIDYAGTSSDGSNYFKCYNSISDV